MRLVALVALLVIPVKNALKTTLNLHYPPFAPDAKCPIVFVVTTWAGGFGHRVGAFAIAVAWAIENNAAVVFDVASIASSARAETAASEQYRFIPKLLNLGAFAATPNATETLLRPGRHSTPWGAMHFRQTPSALAAVRAAREEGCGRIFHMPTGQANACGRGVWCFYAAPGAFERARPVMRQLYASGKAATQPTELFEAAERSSQPSPVTPQLRVAWHVRTGDVVLNQNASFFARLVAAVAAALGPLPAQHLLFTERAIPEDAPGFAFLLELPGVVFRQHAGSRVDVAFRHLAAADVLVTSGSSFAYAAALVGPDSQVVLFAEPKESALDGRRGAIATYRLGGPRVIDIHADGGLGSDGVDRLAVLVRARHAELLRRRGRGR